MCSAITIVHTSACTSMDCNVLQYCVFEFRYCYTIFTKLELCPVWLCCEIVSSTQVPGIIAQWTWAWDQGSCNEMFLCVYKGFALDVQFFLFRDCTLDEQLHMCKTCSYKLCNSCAVDTPRWCSRHRSASTRRDQGRRRESRFRCETTVVAHWASASAASLSRGTRSSSSTQSLLRNDATGISFCQQFWPHPCRCKCIWRHTCTIWTLWQHWKCQQHSFWR